MADDTKNIGLKTPKKPHKSHKGLSSKIVNLEKVRKRLLNVLARDTDHLMRASNEGKLKESEANDLRGYLKLMRELQKQEQDNNASVNDKELEWIASGDFGER